MNIGWQNLSNNGRARIIRGDDVTYIRSIDAVNAETQERVRVWERPSFTVPTVPTAVSVNGIVQGGTITWHPPQDDGGLPITSYQTSANSETQWTDHGPSVRSATHAGVVNTTLILRVRAINGQGAGGIALGSVITLPVPMPVAPTIAPVASQGPFEMFFGSVGVEFTLPLAHQRGVPQATQIQIETRQGSSRLGIHSENIPGGTTGTISVPIGTQQQFQNGVTYNLRVRMNHPTWDGLGNWSNQVNFTWGTPTISIPNPDL